MDFSYEHVLMISVIVGVFAQIGDLFESHLKRTVKVKDSSNLIPGMGASSTGLTAFYFRTGIIYIPVFKKYLLILQHF